MIREAVAWALCAVGTTMFGTQIVVQEPWQGGFALGLGLAIGSFVWLISREEKKRRARAELTPYSLRVPQRYSVGGAVVWATSRENAERFARRRYGA